MLSRLFGGQSGSPAGDAPRASLLTSWRHIFVPAIGAPFSMRAIQTACRLSLNAPGSELKLLVRDRSAARLRADGGSAGR